MSRLLTELVYNGVDLIAEYGLVASGAGTRLSPERDIEEIEVPGRNGNLIIDKKRFRNVTIVYTCALPEEFRSRFDELKNFLLSARGYAKLQDSEDSDHYRMAAVSGVLEPTIKGEDGASLVISFNCKPQRFLRDSAEEPLETKSGNIVSINDFQSDAVKKTFEEIFGKNTALLYLHSMSAGSNTITVVDSDGNEVDKQIAIAKSTGTFPLEFDTNFFTAVGHCTYNFTSGNWAIMCDAEPIQGKTYKVKLGPTVIIDSANVQKDFRHNALPIIRFQDWRQVIRGRAVHSATASSHRFQTARLMSTDRR